MFHDSLGFFLDIFQFLVLLFIIWRSKTPSGIFLSTDSHFLPHLWLFESVSSTLSLEVCRTMEEIGEDCHFFKDDNVCSSENDEDLQMTEINKSFLVKSSATNSKRGVCYLSRIQRHMDHVKLRHILSRYGDIERIYLVPESNRHFHFISSLSLTIIWIFNLFRKFSNLAVWTFDLQTRLLRWVVSDLVDTVEQNFLKGIIICTSICDQSISRWNMDFWYCLKNFVGGLNFLKKVLPRELRTCLMVNKWVMFF